MTEQKGNRHRIDHDNGPSKHTDLSPTHQEMGRAEDSRLDGAAFPKPKLRGQLFRRKPLNRISSDSAV